jgi:hypothetical protein
MKFEFIVTRLNDGQRQAVWEQVSVLDPEYKLGPEIIRAVEQLMAPGSLQDADLGVGPIITIHQSGRRLPKPPPRASR